MSPQLSHREPGHTQQQVGQDKGNGFDQLQRLRQGQQQQRRHQQIGQHQPQAEASGTNQQNVPGQLTFLGTEAVAHLLHQQTHEQPQHHPQANQPEPGALQGVDQRQDTLR